MPLFAMDGSISTHNGSIEIIDVSSSIDPYSRSNFLKEPNPLPHQALFWQESIVQYGHYGDNTPGAPSKRPIQRDGPEV